MQREEFLAPLSGWQPYALALGMLLLADVMFWLLGRTANPQLGGLAALALGLAALVSFVLQTRHTSNPLLWLLPAGRSQNVWTVARPQGETRQSVVVTGHVDTHRTALAMQSPQSWVVFQLLTLITSVGNVVLVVLFLLGTFSDDPLLRTVGLYLGVLPILGLIFTVQPDFTPFVRGANDNATGAAAVLALAERLKAEPLAHTAVYLVNTGAEEVGSFGAAAWIARHQAEVPGADYLVLDGIGGKGSQVNYVLDETLLLPVKSDPGLVKLAETVARENPEIGAQPFHYRGLDSELSVCSLAGQKALGLLNFDPRTRMPPNFHTVRDTLDNVDPGVLARSEQFLWALLQKIDARP